MKIRSTLLACALLPLMLGTAVAQAPQPSWVSSWTASAHGPYPVGNATAQPDLKFAFPRIQAR